MAAPPRFSENRLVSESLNRAKEHIPLEVVIVRAFSLFRYGVGVGRLCLAAAAEATGGDGVGEKTGGAKWLDECMVGGGNNY